jgi:hypothetical protein
MDNAILAPSTTGSTMSDFHFPDITDHAAWAFNLVFTLAKEDAAYINSPDCPYDEGVKKIIRLATQVIPVAAPSTEAPKSSTPISEDEIDATLAEDLHSVFRELKDYGKTIAQSDQTERMAYFRTATSLLERLVNAREKALGVKQIKDFQDTVLTIMEDTLTIDQRTEVMERLRSSITRSTGLDDDASFTTTDETA